MIEPRTAKWNGHKKPNLRAAFAKPYTRGYFKCQYVDQVLLTGTLKQGLLRGVEASTYSQFPTLIQSMHERLLEQLTREGRMTR